MEISQLRAVLDAEHYLKAGRPAGHVLWQGVYQHDPEDGSENLVATLLAASSSSPASMLSTTSSTRSPRHPLALKDNQPTLHGHALEKLDHLPGARQLASLTRQTPWSYSHLF